MKLDVLRKADVAMKQTRFLAIIFAVSLVCAFSVCIFLFVNKVEDAHKKSYIFDKQGNVYTTTEVETKAMRKYEYENHVKMFFEKWYGVDEYTYEDNIKDALELIGSRGEELLNEYKDVNMQNLMMQKNIRYGVTILDVEVNVNTIPVTGTIVGVQTGYRAKGSVSRKISAEFSLYDVSRSRKNVHGCKIEDWIYKYTMIEEGEK